MKVWLKGWHYGRLSEKRQAAIEADMHRGRHVQMTAGRQRLGRLSGIEAGRHKGRHKGRHVQRQADRKSTSFSVKHYF